MGLSNSILGQRPYEQFLTKQEQPFWKQLALGAVGGASNAAGSLFGGGLNSLFGGGQQQQQQTKSMWNPVNWFGGSST